MEHRGVISNFEFRIANLRKAGKEGFLVIEKKLDVHKIINFCMRLKAHPSTSSGQAAQGKRSKNNSWACGRAKQRLA